MKKEANDFCSFIGSETARLVVLYDSGMMALLEFIPFGCEGEKVVALRSEDTCYLLGTFLMVDFVCIYF